jgi:hypothetical protein
VIYSDCRGTIIARPRLVWLATTFALQAIPWSVFSTTLTVRRCTGVLGTAIALLANFAAFLACDSASFASCKAFLAIAF